MFPNIFSHSIDCLFVLLLFFFAVQKLLSLIRSHLFIFAFISIILGDGSNVAAIYARVLCLLSSRSFIVSSLTLKPLIHFEFIFVYGFRECSYFSSKTKLVLVLTLERKTAFVN